MNESGSGSHLVDTEDLLPWGPEQGTQRSTVFVNLLPLQLPSPTNSALVGRQDIVPRALESTPHISDFELPLGSAPLLASLLDLHIYSRRETGWIPIHILQVRNLRLRGRRESALLRG